ncbi:MAG TPA: hypothetical protein DGG94_05905 [Micromonosporaceae bacterium]|nr:hypothetical protein [Micromonosporaceae bacterium]HCU49330.1 hypothetical protein [Micromonosporaceae bacterium]
MKHKIMAALVSVALPALFVVGIAATPAYADCPNQRFCLYPNSGYGGGEYRFSPTTSCTTLSGTINNNANSMRNYRTHYVKMWDLPGCQGSTTYTANPSSYDSSFGNNGFTNKASSLKQI